MWYGVNSKICLSQHSGGVIQMYKLYRQSHWASKDSQKEKKKKQNVYETVSERQIRAGNHHLGLVLLLTLLE